MSMKGMKIEHDGACYHIVSSTGVEGDVVEFGDLALLQDGQDIYMACVYSPTEGASGLEAKIYRLTPVETKFENNPEAFFDDGEDGYSDDGDGQYGYEYDEDEDELKDLDA